MRKIIMPPLHSGQRDIARHPARFKVLSCGRRWGKSRLAAPLCVYESARGKIGFWVAPTFRVARVGWRLLCALGQQVPGATLRKSELMITFPGGGWVQVHSAENPDALRGEGLNYVVMDEAAFAPERAWTEGLRPALADKQGWALFASTPAGRNWYWRLFQRGQKTAGKPDEWPEWASWKLPTSSNPFMRAEEIEDARRSLSERVFQQEFLAEFLEAAGALFSGIAECLFAAEELQDKPQRGRTYVAGLDWGRSGDYTALFIMDAETRKIVFWERFTGIAYEQQIARIEGTLARWGVTVTVAEMNAMGGPLVESLQRRGVPVIGFVTTNATKAVLLDDLQLSLSQRKILIPNDPIITGELYGMEAHKLPSGLYRYGAPEGAHDDTVIALALANHAAGQAGVGYAESLYD